MFGNLGLPELFIALLFWLLPLTAFVWALLTLAHLRRGQAAILARLEALEAALRDVSRPR